MLETYSKLGESAAKPGTGGIGAVLVANSVTQGALR
jgi:hypothetical protein